MRPCTCSVEDCGKPARVRGWCQTHYMRWRKYGDPGDATPRRSANGAGSEHLGYVRSHAYGHPLADSQGRVLVHRVTLYDKIGPGEHPCHWCGSFVRWDDRPVEHPDSSLCVDHLDADRANNDPANLVPSCLACNSRRATVGFA